MKDSHERLLTWILIFVLVASVAGVGYVAVTPRQTTDPYTEFYVLGSPANASNYPTNLSVGETGTLVVGITNHEHRNTAYTVSIVLGNRTVTARTMIISEGETWEGEFAFTPTSAGRKQLSIRLYRGTVEHSNEPYRVLRLWVDASQRIAQTAPGIDRDLPIDVPDPVDHRPNIRRYIYETLKRYPKSLLQL